MDEREGTTVVRSRWRPGVGDRVVSAAGLMCVIVNLSDDGTLAELCWKNQRADADVRLIPNYPVRMLERASW